MAVNSKQLEPSTERNVHQGNFYAFVYNEDSISSRFNFRFLK